MAKHPKRVARSVIRDYGGRVLHSDSHGVVYTFPDGWTIKITARASMQSIAVDLAQVRARYGRLGGQQFARLDARPKKPVLDLTKIIASDHAKIRLGQMREQAGVSDEELLLCLRVPEKVRWSHEHRAWVWIRDRVALPMRQDGEHFIVTTVLWATEELFAQNPRPETA